MPALYRYRSAQPELRPATYRRWCELMLIWLMLMLVWLMVERTGQKRTGHELARFHTPIHSGLTAERHCQAEAEAECIAAHTAFGIAAESGTE